MRDGSLSMRQEKILKFIKEELRLRGYPPSVREIGEAIGLSSSSTVHGHLARLEEKGYIRRNPAKPRAIEVLGRVLAAEERRVVAVPVVGRVTAGRPILAVENIEDSFPLPYDLVKEETVFLLSIRGDSMKEAGILDGDYAIVRQQEYASDGDMVVALLGDEATVKRFYREPDGLRLQPENKAYRPIRTKDARILGKVIGVLRLLR